MADADGDIVMTDKEDRGYKGDKKAVDKQEDDRIAEAVAEIKALIDKKMIKKGIDPKTATPEVVMKIFKRMKINKVMGVELNKGDVGFLWSVKSKKFMYTSKIEKIKYIKIRLEDSQTYEYHPTGEGFYWMNVKTRDLVVISFYSDAKEAKKSDFADMIEHGYELPSNLQE